jgi:hypothetical protein
MRAAPEAARRGFRKLRLQLFIVFATAAAGLVSFAISPAGHTCATDVISNYKRFHDEFK